MGDIEFLCKDCPYAEAYSDYYDIHVRCRLGVKDEFYPEGLIEWVGCDKSLEEITTIAKEYGFETYDEDVLYIYFDHVKQEIKDIQYEL